MLFVYYVIIFTSEKALNKIYTLQTTTAFVDNISETSRKMHVPLQPLHYPIL